MQSLAHTALYWGVALQLLSCLLHTASCSSWPEERVRGESLSPVDPDSKMIPDEQLLKESTRNPEVEPASLDNNKCKPNTSFIWCLPQDYNQEKHPFTCKIL